MSHHPFVTSIESVPASRNHQGMPSRIFAGQLLLLDNVELDAPYDDLRFQVWRVASVRGRSLTCICVYDHLPAVWLREDFLGVPWPVDVMRVIDLRKRERRGVNRKPEARNIHYLTGSEITGSASDPTERKEVY